MKHYFYLRRRRRLGYNINPLEESYLREGDAIVLFVTLSAFVVLALTFFTQQ